MPRWLASGQAMTVLFVLTLLIGVTALRIVDPTAYLRAMRVWVPESLPDPFADSAYIVDQLRCWRSGVDVYVSNSCDLHGRGFAYPPLWLRLWFLPSTPAATVPFALSLSVGFAISLAVLPRARRTRDMLVLWAAIASSATAYAVERGNVDLLIFILTAIAIVTAERRLPFRTIGYAAIACAALLKLYPVFLLGLIARERRRVGIALAATILTVGLVAIWSWHAQWISMFANIPGPEYSTDGPGGRKLPEGLFIIIGRLAAWFVPGLQLDDLIPRRAAVAGVFAMISLPAAFAALRLSRSSGFADAIRRLTRRESICLASGALLFCGCFVAGTSIAYRETMVLFAIPALLSFQYEPELPRAVRWAAFMMIPLMWGSYPALLFDIGFGPLHGFGGPLPTFGFWLLREIAWWWLFIILAAALFCIAGQAGLVTTEPTASHPRRRLHG